VKYLNRLLRKSEAAGSRLTPDLTRQIRQSFDEASSDEEHFPSTIDPRIQHVKLLLREFGDLAGKRVLDCGCGKGRFARVLLEKYPAAKVTGMDISEAMLRYLPSAAAACSALMTSLPFATNAFDATYATESLEHAVDIDTAVAELCRVTKLGGRIVIIDKNADHWGRFKTPEWEKWFTPKELERLLSKHCSKVSSEFISYWEDVKPDGLFVAWTATK
jgi:ubiquinone/menaquinone biosynthesis C-methylase UbiE